MKQVIKLIAVVAVFSILFCGCNAAKDPDNVEPTGSTVPATQPEITEPDEKTFIKNGFSLTLPDGFEDHSDKALSDSYDFLYTNGQMGIGIIRQTKPEGSSLEDYVNQEAEYHRTELTQKEGFWTITYEDLDSNEPQTFINVYYEDADAYWMVQGYCPSQGFDQYKTQIWQYITGGVFAGE